MTVSNELSLTTLKSEEFTLTSASFKPGGVYHKIHLVPFLYIFLLVDCFRWALIDCIEKWRVHSGLWQFQTSGVYHKIHLVTFLYIFLLVACSKWALIDCIEKWRVHSDLCQFQLGVYHKIHLVTFLYIFLWVVKIDPGGYIVRFTWWHFFISSY